MKIVADLNRMEINGYKIEVSHGDETLYFAFAVFNKANFGVGNEVFKYVNMYWEQQTPFFQETVFKIYKEIDESFNDILNKKALTDRLKDAVRRLYEMHKFADMKEWLQRRSGLVAPEGFNESYKEDVDRKTTEDKTYLKSDYRELMTLSLMLRLMVPVWAKYTKHIRQHAGNLLKELQSFKLLEQTEIPDLPPVHKLLRYIRSKLKKDATNIPVSFISEDDHPYWNMALICVRKLCVGDLQSKDPRANLVTLIHNFITAQSGYPDGDFANTIHSKKPDNFGDDDNKISTMEAHRVNMDISVAHAVMIPFSVENLDNVVQQVCFDLDPQLLQHCLETSQVMVDHVMMRPQKALMGWVLKNAISPSGLDYLEKDAQVRCLGLTQAVLWQRGFKYLALLSTAVAPISSDHRVAVGPTKERIPPDLLKELREVFPHVRVVQHRKTEPREECRIINDIETIVDDFFSFLWQPTASEAMIKEVMGRDATNRRIHIRSDIRLQLAQLAIAVGRNKISNP